MPFVEKPPANALRSNHATFEIDILLSLFSYFVLPSIHDSFSFLFFLSQRQETMRNSIE